MINKVNEKLDDILVSVIVPAYNVEKYIEKCLMSILKQTHKNIEVIIIDDGSKDSTKLIIDTFARRDKRIQIISQNNSGVSVARNTGIEISRGNYIVFIDGDDYIAADYVRYMLNLIEKTGSDFCLSTKCYTKKVEKQVESEFIKKLTPEEATSILLSPDVIVGCWNKIYSRQFIINKGLKFSNTLFYGEGLTFITSAAQLADSVGVGNRKVYYYRRNNESSATTQFNIEKIYNGEVALNNIRNNFTVNSEKVKTMHKLHTSLFYLSALVRMRTHSVKKEYKKDYMKWRKKLLSNTLNLIFKKEVSYYRKAMLIGGCISPLLMMKLDIFRRKKISLNSVD